MNLATVKRNADPKSGSVILNAWRREYGPEATGRFGVHNDATATMSISEFADWVKGTYDFQPGAVTERTAMNISTVHACVNLIGGAIASVPLVFYRRTPGNEREPYRPDEWWMLNEQPCTSWGAATAWEFATQSLLLRGDSFWQILRASRLSPKIVGFEPKHPSTVTVRRVEDRNAYDIDPQISDPTGTRRVTLDQDDVLHVPGPGFDGLRGMSQIASVLKLAGGLALSADEWTRAFFLNSARPDYALETDGSLNPDQIKNLKDQVDEAHKGVRKSWRPIVLQGGLKVKAITVNPEDMQLMELRKFQVEDVCRSMGVPPFMVGHTEKTTSWGSGVEQMSIGFVKYTLQRHLVKFEQEINRKVFRTARNFCEFNTAGLERGDLKTRYEAFRIAMGRAGEMPWMGYDEVRRLENLPPRTDLKINPGSTPKKEGNDEPTAAAADR